ncbi:MAG: hypothetical protein M0D54_10845 [Hyphomonadaceae bacterium JAD_PAG50586_4]|nr:MAG: hypothetical protein M0D54_10845 [Hyphomonadaceae bacterium JAD_PAG50586_4]
MQDISRRALVSLSTAGAIAAASAGPAAAQDATPVCPRERPGDDEPRPPPAGGVGLALSGGGYKAAVFHLGSLVRLNELGALPQIQTISSVSGGLSHHRRWPSGGLRCALTQMALRPISRTQLCFR